MERLSVETGECCHLNIVDQNHMLVVARVESTADVMLTVRVGASFALHERTSGMVALAMFLDHRRREYWKQTNTTAARIKSYEAQLKQIRKQGFAIADSAVAVGARDCATPVMGNGASLLGVLCISYFRRTDENGDRDDIIQSAVDCAQAISAEFVPGK